MTIRWEHDALQNDLASHLHAGGARMLWTNIVMGEAGSPRPDVLSMARYSWALEFTAFEVKISVADFRSDVTSGKWQKYLAFAQGVTFAVPAGLVTIGDVPKACGLIERSDGGWRHRRKPTLAKLDLQQKHMIKLLREPVFSPSAGQVIEADGHRSWRKDMLLREEQAAVRNAEHRAGQRLGKAIAIYLRDVSAAEGVVKRAQEDARKIIEHAQDEAKAERERARAMLDEVAEALGIEKGTSGFELRRAVSEACGRLAADGEVLHLRTQLGAIDKALRKAKPIGETAKSTERRA